MRTRLAVAAVASALLTLLAGCPAAAPSDAGEGEGETGEGEGEGETGEGEGEAGEGEGEGEGEGPAVFRYVEVPDTMCANGTVTGIGVSPAPGTSTTLAVLFFGGGACWDAFTCFGINAATHLSTTYDEAVMQADLAPVAQSGVTDRQSGPFADAALAFLPYCTADLHAGDATRQYQADLLGLDIRTVNHRGRANVIAFASELATRFPDTERVFLLGISAGGYGAMLNHDVFAAAFPGASVDVIVDGAPMVPPQNGLYFTWQSQWTMALPAGCDGCNTDFGAIIEHVRTSGARVALASTTNDDVIRAFFGYGIADMTPQVIALQASRYASDDAKAFVVAGQQHVLLGAYTTFAAPNGVTLKDWLDGFVAGDARWVSVAP